MKATDRGSQSVSRWLRPLFAWARRTDAPASESRAVLARVLFAAVWLPIQITLSLLFATGGLFLLLILGMALAPFVGGFLLIRHLARGGERVRGGSTTGARPRGR